MSATSTGADRSSPVWFLKPQVKLEPLVLRWYAWPHLVAPAQHALNVTFRHLDLMRSFLQSPAAHIAAARDHSLYGGPFLDLREADIPAVKALMEETLTSCSQRVAFAKALKAFERVLAEQAKGFSFAALYAQIPAALDGLIELAYDLDNRARLRLHEELLYQQHNSRELQEVCLSFMHERERPFFMSTPRLRRPEDLSVRVPFASDSLDALAAMRTRGGDIEQCAELLGLSGPERSRFPDFFTQDAPVRQDPEYAGPDVRVRYFGHACVLIQTASTSILVDPMFSFESGHGDARLTFQDLPDSIDCVVLSHNHQDHCSPEMLLQLRHKVRKIVVPRSSPGSLADPSMKLILRELGYSNIQVVEPFDTIPTGDCNIRVLPFVGEHADLDISTKQSILIEANARRLLFLVDTDGTGGALYERVARVVGNRMDAVFLGMECHGAPLSWLYGPLLTRPVGRKDDESRRLSGANCERALGMLRHLLTPRVFVYAMGQESWLKYIMGLEYSPDSIQLQEVSKLIQACADTGIRAEQLHVRADLVL